MFKRIRQAISRRVHNPRLQRRLEFGSALALGVGLVISASIFFSLFDIERTILIEFLHPANNPPSSGQLMAETRLMQILVIFLVALLAGATLDLRDRSNAALFRHVPELCLPQIR